MNIFQGSFNQVVIFLLWFPYIFDFLTLNIKKLNDYAPLFKFRSATLDNYVTGLVVYHLYIDHPCNKKSAS